MDGTGLISYGDCCFSLKNITVKNRATLLEENSYTFVRRHNIIDSNHIPPGFRSTWAERYKLAVAKLAKYLDKNITYSSFQDLVLRSDGNRENDDFIEIHIYGNFDNQAIDSIKIPNESKIKDATEKAFVKIIKECANQKKISCEEYDY